MSAGQGGWHIERKVTIGHIVTTGAICFGLAGQWFLMQAKNEQQDRDIARVESMASANALGLRNMQETLGRVDERSLYMVETLNRIERRQDGPQ